MPRQARVIVELNPVKESPEFYRWSSYSARVGLVTNEWLDEPPTFADLGQTRDVRIEGDRAFMADSDTSNADVLIRQAIGRNKLTGGDRFIDEVERRTGVRVELRGPGRPPTGNK